MILNRKDGYLSPVTYLALFTIGSAVGLYLGNKSAEKTAVDGNKIQWTANVEKIIQHPPPQSNFYTVFCTSENPANSVRQLWSTEVADVQFIVDNQTDKPMWIEYRFISPTLHIHSLEDVEQYKH